MSSGIVASTRATVRFESDTSSVGEARRWLVGFLGRFHVDPGRCDDAVLVVSELVTNAVRHGHGRVSLGAAVSDDGEVYLEVSDAGAEMPVMLDPDPLRIGGVGLQIVDQLSTHWGVAPFDGGKTVWARFAREI